MSVAGRLSVMRWKRRAAVWFLICLAALSGCEYPSLNLITVSSVTATHGSSAQGPTSTHVPSTLVPSPIPPSQASQPSPSQAILPTLSPPSPTPIPRTTVPAQYDLEATLDYARHSITVHEKVRYANLSSDRMVDLVLIVEPNLTPQGFELLGLGWEDGSSVEPYTLENNLLQVPLPQPLEPGAALGMVIDYRLELPPLTDISLGFRPVAYGYSSAQTNLVDWYAYMAPYRAGEGWLVHPLWAFGEYQVYDVADYNVSLRLAEPVDGLVIAASAPARQEGDHYTYHLEAARTFALSASTDYVVQTATAGDVTIHSYSFPFDTYAGQEALHATAQAVELYSRLFLPYPRSTLSVVEADFLDGMEYDGIFFLSRGFYDLYDGTPKGYLTFIAAHETAHQWWYGLVGNDQALEPWLDEGLCTYMERVFYENYYSDNPPHSGGSLVDWWWYYRVNFYNPSGWVDGAIYNFSNIRAYRDAVYLSGAKFLEDLRNLVGDQAFFAFLRDFTLNNAHKIATAQDFFDSLRRHTAQNLDGILSTYFQNIK